MTPTLRQLSVFLCHASQDKAIVRELQQRLADEGWINPWLDEKKLHPGEEWRMSIEEAVEQSDLVVICLSINSVNKEGFIQKELRYAREIALEKPEGTIFLIPLRLDDCEVPRGLRFFQWTDYFGDRKEQNYAELLESLSIRRLQVIRREEELARKKAEEQEKKEREEQARREAEKLERKKQEEQSRKDAEERAVREAEEFARKQTEEKVRKEAEERAHRDTLEKIQKEAYEKARKEAEEKSRLEIETRVRKEAEEKEGQKEVASKIKFLSINIIIIVVLACVALSITFFSLLSSTSFTNWIKENFQPSSVYSPALPIATETASGLPSTFNRFLTLQLASALQEDSTQAPGKVAVDNLQLTPGNHVFNGIPIDYQYEINTQNQGAPNYPQKITIPSDAQNPLAVYLLIQADWGYARYANQTIGKIVVNFNNGSSYEYPLVMGVNIRDWKRGNAPEAVTTITSSDIFYSWSGLAPDGYSGGMDLLRISIPIDYQNFAVTFIEIVDVTYQTTGDYDPGVRILASTIELRGTP